MKIISLKALLASVFAIVALTLPLHGAYAQDPAPAKVCEDGKPCSAQTAENEEPSDEDLEDSCEDDGVF